MESGSNLTISNSTFSNLGSTSLSKGAGIYSQRSHLTLDQVVFVNNTAKNGAAVNLE
jgi:hypothetical protein